MVSDDFLFIQNHQINQQNLFSYWDSELKKCTSRGSEQDKSTETSLKNQSSNKSCLVQD